jgi:hypothetical protein
MTSHWPYLSPFSAGTAERSRPDAHKQVPRPAPGRHHPFIHYANSRYASCVRCGKPEHDLVHRVEA